MVESTTANHGKPRKRGLSFARMRLSLFPQAALERSWKICEQNHEHSSSLAVGPARTHRLRSMATLFAVEDIDAVVARLLAHGAELIGEVVQYEDMYRLAYIRGSEGIIVGLNEQIG